jgi:hypothetical protein
MTANARVERICSDMTVDSEFGEFKSQKDRKNIMRRSRTETAASRLDKPDPTRQDWAVTFLAEAIRLWRGPPKILERDGRRRRMLA